MEQPNEQQPLALRLVTANWPTIIRFFIAAIIFAGLYLLIDFFRQQTSYLEYIDTLTRWASTMLAWMGVAHEARDVTGFGFLNQIVTDVIEVYLKIDRNYDGLVSMALLISVLASLRGRLIWKLIYIPICTAIMVVMNALLIAVTVAFEQHYPLYQFELQEFVAPLITIFIPMLLLIYIWFRFINSSSATIEEAQAV